MSYGPPAGSGHPRPDPLRGPPRRLCSSPPDRARCSVGFSVTIGFLSAGHCAAIGSSIAGYNHVPMGSFVTYRFRVLPAALVAERPRALAPRTEADPVASAEMALYHRPGCLLVVGKPVSRQSRRGHESAGRRPCGVCQP